MATRPFALLRIARAYAAILRYLNGSWNLADRGAAPGRGITRDEARHYAGNALTELRDIATNAVTNLQQARAALAVAVLEDVTCRKLLEPFWQEGDTTSDALQVALDAYAHCKAAEDGLRDDIDGLLGDLEEARDRRNEAEARLSGVQRVHEEFLAILRPFVSDGARIDRALQSLVGRLKGVREERDYLRDELAVSQHATKMEKDDREAAEARALECAELLDAANDHITRLIVERKAALKKYSMAIRDGLNFHALGEGQILVLGVKGYNELAFEEMRDIVRDHGLEGRVLVVWDKDVMTGTTMEDRRGKPKTYSHPLARFDLKPGDVPRGYYATGEFRRPREPWEWVVGMCAGRTKPMHNGQAYRGHPSWGRRWILARDRRKA